MLLLTSTSDIIRIVTDSTATVDVHASWVDLNGSTQTPGRTNTAISSSTTTTVVAAPGASTYRNVKRLSVRNRHASTSVTVTIQHWDGTTSIELDKRVLGPGGSILFTDDYGWIPVPGGGPQTRPWFGVAAGCFRDGDPGYLIDMVQKDVNIAATPTNITTSIARCSSFMLPFDLTFNRIRAYGVGATTNVYRVAIYRYSDLARLTAELPFTTAANTWVSIGSALNVTLAKDTLYFVACSVNATGTVAGPTCFGDTLAATTGQIATAPGSLPGSLALSGGKLSSYQFQFAVTTGALPNPAAAPAAQAAWTGGMPAFWLDSADV